MNIATLTRQKYEMVYQKNEDLVHYDYCEDDY